MKIRFIAAAAALAGIPTLRAATLSAATAVQSQPDPASAVIAVLPAGSEQPAPPDKVGIPPSGWIAVEVAGPFEGYVRNSDLTKELDVHPGSTIYVAPKDGAAVLAVFQKGDKAEITGLHGRWTQVHLEKTLIGYIEVNPTPPAAASAPLATPPQAAAPAAAPAPAAAAAAAPSPDAGNVRLSRLYEGTLASTKSLLFPKRPYDWQITDASGKRIAYVDLSKLLLTDQIENYAGHGVVVLGSLVPVKDSGDLVIEVVGLRLK
jgi:hypothetical protein